MAELIRCLLKRPGEPVAVVTVTGGRPGLHEMERLLGCDMFDHVGLAVSGDVEIGLYVDDEGLLKGLPPTMLNPRSGQPLVGPVLLVRHDRYNGHQVSLDDEEITRWTKVIEELSP